MDATTSTPDEFICSFCGRMYPRADPIIGRSGVYICDKCVDVCANVVKKVRKQRFIQQTREACFKELWEGA